MDGDFRIGEWQAQTRSNVLVRGSRRVHVEPKVMDVLTMLVKRQGEVLSKEEIIGEVWAGTFVTDEALWRCISALRSVFRDDAKDPQFIQTIPKRGYRLIASVSRPGECECRNAKQIGKTGLVHCIGSIAVLPFVDLSESQDLGFFCDGLAEEITDSMTRVKGLRVAARTSCLQFRGKVEDVRSIGKQLGVRTVLEGSVRRSDGKYRVTVQLVCSVDGCHIWSEKYEGKTGELFSIHDQIARAVVEKLHPAIAAARQPS